MHRSATLGPLARALGGEAYAGGRRALAHALGHGAADRSVSLRLVDGRVLVHSFGAADWREVLDWLRGAGWIDAENRLRGEGGRWPAAPSREERTRAERVQAAQRFGRRDNRCPRRAPRRDAAAGAGSTPAV
jgi:hypothetical protein